LRIAILGNKSKREGLSNGKPFETLCTKDLDWFKFSTKEINIYRWKNAICYFCKGKLNTDHLKTCRGTEREREIIKNKTGVEAVKLLEDPSILNSLPNNSRKSMKSFVAERVSKMIHSAGRRVIV